MQPEKKAYKKCAQCGFIKDVNDFKIKYTRANGEKSRNRYCRSCEELTHNYNSLMQLKEAGALSALQERELVKMTSAFQVLEKQGLSTPLSRRESSTTCTRQTVHSHLENIMEQYPEAVAPRALAATAEAMQLARTIASGTEVPEFTVDTDVPEELTKWLKTPFETWRDKQLVPEYLNDVVYPALKAQYRPEIGWDAVALAPRYDDTYKAVLAQVSDRFWEYEDWYRDNLKQEETDEET